MFTMNTDYVSVVHSELGPEEPIRPLFKCSAPDENGMVTIGVEFKMKMSDNVSLSVSKGTGDNKVSFGLGQGGINPESPFDVIDMANFWEEEERTKEIEKKAKNVIRVPECYFKK